MLAIRRLLTVETPTVCSRVTFHNRSSVPRVVDDREKARALPDDAGYVYRYHRPGVDPLPRIPGCRVPVARPSYHIRDAW
ncbi:unnamed protein product, partial [Strongylus vulgaris]